MFPLRRLWNVLIKQEKQIFRRWTHDNVCVRFAPSPTGHLHLGGLRTALYNYLFARNQNGKFILRIEDTDRTRIVPGATESIIQDLQWAGFKIDEGPGFGNAPGPFLQSERTDFYLAAVQQLLANDSAYRCFCSERRLELLRKEAIRLHQIPRYDNKCRYLTPQQIAVLLAKGTKYCIRFKLNEYNEPFNDLIYGAVTHNVSLTEGDPVIIKTDNFPTYHFANVVDDHMMGVTHVFRGVEWQISTVKHLLLYNAFGWKPPQFGHLPLLVNADGTKLSKRQGDIGIKHFMELGYFPETLINYVISSGGGFKREQGQKPVIYSLDELAEQFDINCVNSHPTRLNPELLDELNRLYILKMLNNENDAKELVQSVQTMVYKAYPKEQNLDLNPTHISNVLQWASKRLTFIQDLTASKFSFLWIKPKQYSLKDITEEQMNTLIKTLKDVDFDKDVLNETLKDFSKKEKLKFSTFMKALRSALSGLKEGPGVAEMMDILGKQAVLQRLQDTILMNNSDENSNKSDKTTTVQ